MHFKQKAGSNRRVSIRSCKRKNVCHLADLIEEGYELVIAHGNGPQVGRIVIQNEYSSKVTPLCHLIFVVQ